MSERARHFHVFGEDFPLLLPLGLLLLGVMLTGAAHSLWLEAEPRTPAASSTGAHDSAALPAVTASDSAAPAPPGQPATAVATTAATERGATAPALPRAESTTPGSTAAGRPSSPPAQPKAAPPSSAPPDCAPVFAVHFVAGGAVPRVPIADKIDRLAGWLQAHPGTRLWLDGYSDQLGPVAGRFAISQRRAQAVASALQRAGVPRAQLKVRAFGHYLPTDSAGPLPDAQRLVRLHVDGQPDCPEERSNLP